MIQRHSYTKKLKEAIRRSPVVSLLGPRQCGKTTLARFLEKKYQAVFLDLESPQDQMRLQNPELMLGALEGLVIIDEIQIMPELFGILRVLVDRADNKTNFLILGSASPHIIKNVSETLAGRTEFIELAGFNYIETGGDRDSINTLWLRGGFPMSYLSNSLEDSLAWREGFVRTFLERDIPQLGITIPAIAMRRFWTMLAHYHGQTLNASEIGRSLGLSDKTIRSYLDILTGTYMMRQLLPWHENIGKRQVKAPKIYFRDVGILHSLLAVTDMNSLMVNPRLGASWEGFALEQALRILQPVDVYFWATYSGAELDLLFFKNGKRYGVEFKFNEAPKLTKSMRIAVEDLNLTHLWVVHPGKHAFPVEKQISMLPLHQISKMAF
ncbi:MAG: ATP-binding protein [Desulfobacula sp.]|uniref:ATP-binding protein n=1 Tax=Desulfobacula sp. TaxID=2593537 RepID=UPI0025BEDC19|nr:ATP-binding protein [Desulfobacula sp.]MCD4721832.1 ATP-binding protein [Desulfobacula sp.]